MDGLELSTEKFDLQTVAILPRRNFHKVSRVSRT